MASDINGILMRYEIDTFEILQSKRKGNLLVTDPIATTDGGFSASMMDVPWGSIQHLGHHNWEQEQLNGVTVFFDCDTYVVDKFSNLQEFCFTTMKSTNLMFPEKSISWSRHPIPSLRLGTMAQQQHIGRWICAVGDTADGNMHSRLHMITGGLSIFTLV